MTPDVNVVLLDFPKPGNEMVFENEDGSFTIMINSRLSHNRQLLAYNHAMKHIQDSDFQKADVQAIEAAAHGTRAPGVSVEDKHQQKKECPAWLKAIRARNKKLHKELDRYAGVSDAYNDYGLSNSQQWFGGNI